MIPRPLTTPRTATEAVEPWAVFPSGTWEYCPRCGDPDSIRLGGHGATPCGDGCTSHGGRPLAEAIGLAAVRARYFVAGGI